MTHTGTVTAGSSGTPAAGETVTATLNGVNVTTQVGANGAFSITFNTATLPASGSAYNVSFSYGCDNLFAAKSTELFYALIVYQAVPVVQVVTI